MKKSKLLSCLVTMPLLGSTLIPLVSCGDEPVTYKVSTDGSSLYVSFSGLTRNVEKGKDINATYSITSETKKLDEVDSDILIGTASIKGQPGVVYKNGTITVPADLITGDVTIKILVQDITAHKILTTGTSSDVTITGLPQEWHEGESYISATYTISDSYRKLDEINSNILIGTTSIKTYPGVTYKGGKIIIPANLITGNVTVRLVTQDKMSYTVATTGSSSDVIFGELPQIWYEGGEDIYSSYSYDETTLKVDEVSSDILIGTKSIKSESGVVYKGGYIVIPASLITDDITIKIIVMEKTSHSVSTQGSSPSVSFSGLPTEIKTGDIDGTYTYDTTLVELDEDKSDILIGTTSIKSHQGVTYKSGTIHIPSDLIDGNVTIKIVTKDLQPYKIFTDSSSSDVTFSGLPTTWTSGDISGTYSYDTVTKKLDEDKSDILISGKSIKSESGVVFTNETITIPASLITGHITIKIIVDYQDGYISTSWSNIISACNTFEESDRGTQATNAFLASFTVGGKTQLTSLADLLGAWTCVTINGQTHKVRIIGTQHDTLSSSETKATAALTFETLTLLSGSDGARIKSHWGNDNCDYTNSTLRKNLNGQGTGTQSFANTVFSMLPTEVSSGIKEVTKKVGICIDSSTSFTATSYNDKLFPITRCEITAWASSRANPDEGKMYDYFSAALESEKLVKKDANGVSDIYWLASPNTEGSDEVWRIDTSGELYWNNKTTDDRCISFGFCI